MKNIIIVGATSGIGKATAEKLLSNGHQVISISRTAVGEVPYPNHIQLDITSDFEKINGIPEQIDGLVYFPGTIHLKPFRSLSLPTFQEDYNINVLGAIKILKACEKALKKGKNASVVFISTVAVQTGLPFHASISAAKGAIEGLTKSLAAEWAPKVRVNAIAPSLIDTPLAASLLNSEDKKERNANRHPLKRVGKPSDIASMVVYLLDEQSDWITGQIIKIDGGFSSIH